MKRTEPKPATGSGKAQTSQAQMSPMLHKHETMLRRATNHNVHVITHHGKVQIGRKGRTT